MTISNPVNIGQAAATTGASLGIVTTVGVNSGNTILIAVSVSGGDVASITDTAGTVYVTDQSLAQGGLFKGELWRGTNTLGLSVGQTITLNSGSTFTGIAAAAVYVTGALTSGTVIDASTTAIDSATTNAQTITISNYNDLLLGVSTGVNGMTLTSESAGFTGLNRVVTAANTNVVIWAYDNASNVPGNQVYNATLSDSNAHVRALLGYIPAPPGTPPITPSPQWDRVGGSVRTRIIGY